MREARNKIGLAILVACLAARIPAYAVTPSPAELAQKEDWVNRVLLSTNTLPFSFTYGGQSSSNLLKTWTRTVVTNSPGGNVTNYIVSWTNAGSMLKVYCSVVSYYDVPAAEWTVGFTNAGSSDSLAIAAVNGADVVTNVAGATVTLNRINGASASSMDFIPAATILGAGASISDSPFGGRSSNGRDGRYMPFFNMSSGAGGMFWAIGWSGSWTQQVSRDVSGNVRIASGFNGFNSILHAGEHARGPRMMFVFWNGTNSLRGNNLFRKTLVDHLIPRRNGAVILPDTSFSTYDTVFSTSTETSEKAAIARTTPLGVETHWVDANWMNGGFPDVGNWYPDPARFPTGLKPISDAAHSSGQQFLLWFEPERARDSSYIGVNYPSFLLPGFGSWAPDYQLYDLGNPAAFTYMTNLIATCVTNWGIDIYRTDFNLDPLTHWQGDDAVNRKGMTENLHIQGLYAMWDGLHAMYPNLVFDNCASGGRRIDLELMDRSYTRLRSDAFANEELTPEWDQVQTAGMSLCNPLNGTINVHGCLSKFITYAPISLSKYGLRSTLAAGWDFEQDATTPGYNAELFKQMISDTKAIRSYYLGDFYPLTPINTNGNIWAAWQFNRPDQKDGIVQVFRRSKNQTATTNFPLSDLDSDKYYTVQDFDSGITTLIHGSVLTTTGLPLRLAAAQSAILRYQAVTGCLVTAGVTGTDALALPATVQFTAAGFVTNAATPSYAWAFGDGNSSLQQNPSHAYSAAGLYQATVTMNDGNGNVASSTVPVTITGPFTWQMPITFPGYTQPESLTNFPVLLVFSNSLITGFHHSTFSSPNGWDLRFTDATGTKALNHEIESWNVAGLSHIWVQVPALSNGTALRAYWGNSYAALAPAACTTNGATWTNAYVGVYHMAADSGVPSGADATRVNNGGAVGNVPAAAGRVGGGASFIYAGTNSIFIPDDPSLRITSRLTLSAWVRQTTRDRDGMVVQKRNPLTDNPMNYGLWLRSDGKLLFEFHDGTYRDMISTNVVPLDTWTYMTVAVDESAGTKIRIYLNGQQDSTPAYAGNMVTTGEHPLQIGNYSRFDGGIYQLNGSVDEVRVSAQTHSSNWVWACYQTMASNAAFTTYGVSTNSPSSIRWTAYNDCAWASDDVVGGFTGSFTTNNPVGLATGTLMAVDGQVLTGTTVAMTTNGSGFNFFAAFTASTNITWPAGTDAALEFEGRIGRGYATQIEGTNPMAMVTVTLAGLQSNRQYKLVVWSSRLGESVSSDYSNRLTDVTLLDADSFINNSSVAYHVTRSTLTMTDDTTTVPANLRAGYAPVTRYEKIRPGTNGMIRFTVKRNALSTGNAYLNAFKLEESDLSGDADGDGMDDTWETAYFGGPNVEKGGALEDFDGDGSCNYAEYRAGTNPTNDLSRLQFESAVLSPSEAALVLEWQSATGRSYSLLSATNLASGWSTQQMGIAATPPMNRTNSPAATARGFIRVKVE